MGITNLTSARQNKDEFIADYFKHFRRIRNRCFDVTFKERDLAEIAVKGLRPSIREKIEGQDPIYLAITQTRAMGHEERIAKDREREDRQSNTHVLDYKSDDSTNDEKDIYATEFCWLAKTKVSNCTSLRPLTRVGKRRLSLHLTYPNVRAF